MRFSDDAKALALTLKSIYGDLLDLPILQPSAPKAGTTSSPAALSPSEALAAYAEEIRYCQQCLYHAGRRNLVFGRGSPHARIAFVGDFPSDQDDAKGEPFSDEAGDLLSKMILAVKIKPEEAYLTTLSKCRPPTGSRPEQDRFDHEEEHLKFQFSHLQAEFIVALGDTTARTLARSESPLRVLRNQTFEWEGRKVFCTHHPRDLLKSPAKKKEAWEDLQAVMRAMGLK
jgi:DNA polymerase